ncbi:apolipoprotein F [Sminthopsis crassicaudata]|uniref:apolipoprotein F n=1 Tax=Sminthopsis crassicaudata TaxID=9301 RepID=UPI003D68F11D
MPVLMLLCGFLLYPVAAGSQPKTLPLPPPTLDPQPPILSPLSCGDLLPESLPHFNHLAPLPRYLVSLALYIPLEQAGCPTDARNLRQQLHGLGGVKATETLLRQLHGLPGDKRDRKSERALLSMLQLLGRRPQRPGRSARTARSLSAPHCISEKEQRVHSIIQLLPQVGSYYNLGTAFYYAALNCTAQAWERGQEAGLDLGYDLLVGLMGVVGGPVGVAAGVVLRPVVKSEARRLIEYYYSNKEELASPPLSPGPSGQDWGLTPGAGGRPTEDHGPSSSELGAEEVTEAPSLWSWRSFSIWG